MNRLNRMLHIRLKIRDFSAPGGPFPSREDYKAWDRKAREVYRIVAAIRRPWDVSA